MAGSALRRLNYDQPMTPLAIWANTLAKTSIVVALLALAASHARGGVAGFVAVLTLSPTRAPSPGLGLFLFVTALVIAAAAALLALAALVAIWRDGRRGARHVIAVFLLLTLFIPYPAWLIHSAGAPPFLADISTDYEDPPAFSADAAVAGARGWVPKPLDAGRAQEQVDAYPDAKPILLDLETDEAFNAARDAATHMGWTVLDEIRPGGAARPEGRIEALTYSLALHIPIAVSIRIKPAADQTRVDMRVVMRYAPNDLGAGASLIGKLTEALEDKDSED
ncbi:ABC-type multidrug transport system fused ATPase/permease subunit [Rhodoblastus sphagnicola]|nr:DUF1499 domain-containing protein [Rhodoblastus sphagnicola]MBB4197723.1 ABC-type multidrug transport system fused ATPase/permease subunit [Rhodoblastus sphagnicola]